MTDIYHYLGSDIGLSSTGDLLAVSGTEEGKQRVLRRLLTNPGDYIWHFNYGAGLPKMIGDNVDVDAITAIIDGQMRLESVVSQSPAPIIDVLPTATGVFCSIQYNDAISTQSVNLSFNVNR